jgi:hypothetical protein
MKARKFTHGLKVRDKITGLEGIVTGYCDYITGCNQYLVQPPVKDGDYKDSHWIDEGRLDAVGTGVTGIEQTDTGADKPAQKK